MARIDTLNNYLTDVSQAIKDKKGDQTPIKASDFDTEIANLPTGGGVRANADDDVLFIDYDGEIVISYSKEEFLQLTELPPNPTHEGLISQGWNWTLADAQDYVSKYDGQVIGQNYVTDDNTLRLYVKINPLAKEVGSSITCDGELTIDWGDGTIETFSSGGDFTHSYAKIGDYVIKYKSDNIMTLRGTNSYYSILFYNPLNKTEEGKNYQYLAGIKKIELPNNVSLKRYAITGGVETITVPKEVAFTDQYSIYSLKFLKSIVLSPAQTSMYYYFAFYTGVKYVSIPKEMIGLNSTGFGSNKRLKRLYIPQGVSRIGGYFMQGSSIERFAIPDVTYIDEYFLRESSFTAREFVWKNKMTYFGNYMSINVSKIIFKEEQTGSFYYTPFNSNIKEIIFEKGFHPTTSPYNRNWSLKNAIIDFSGNTRIFAVGTTFTGGIDANSKIIVPDELYDEWIIAENWSTIADRIIKKSDWDALKG